MCATAPPPATHINNVSGKFEVIVFLSVRALCEFSCTIVLRDMEGGEVQNVLNVAKSFLFLFMVIFHAVPPKLCVSRCVDWNLNDVSFLHLGLFSKD